MIYHDDVEALVRWASEHDVILIGVDNLPGSLPIDEYDLPRRCLLLFGQEGPGLSAEARAAVRDVLHLKQFGSTRSINAGVASGVAMYEWVRRHAR